MTHDQKQNQITILLNCGVSYTGLNNQRIIGEILSDFESYEAIKAIILITTNKLKTLIKRSDQLYRRM